MTCREAIDKLAEYLDAELTPAVLRQIDAHLAICAPCRAYVATYQKTRELVTKVLRAELPLDIATRLRTFLIDHMAHVATEDACLNNGTWDQSHMARRPEDGEARRGRHDA